MFFILTPLPPPPHSRTLVDRINHFFMKSIFKNFVVFLLVFIVIAGLFSILSSSSEKKETIGIEKVVELVDHEQVKQIIVKGATLEIVLIDDAKKLSRKEPTESLSELLRNYGVSPDKTRKISIEVRDNEGFGFWAGAILPFLVPFVIIIALIYFMMRQVQGANSKAMSFGQSGAREVSSKGAERVSFKDVAGCKEAKEELQEIVEFLKTPKKFVNLGAKIPKGVLLMGAPGTGKTLLAKAVAGEANVPFLTISGSEFVEMFVGVGASRVRDLFKKAKKIAPCIIFIDEIDAVGRQRGAGLGGSHDEREQTLNQILVEMDGMETRDTVIVMAATNRPDILDQALLRPGRFDRRVVIDIPDIAAREEILNVHKKKKPLDETVNLHEIAQRTPGFSGADLANLLNEAAILAARQNKKSISQLDILTSIERVMLGPERKSHILTPKEKEVTAYHEAGHALVAHTLPDADPVHKISIVSRGQAAGYTLKLPIEDRKMHTRSEFIADLAVMLGGHTAEQEIFGQVTTGASNDLMKATKLARALVTQFGMSTTFPPRTFGEKEELIFLGKEIHERRDYSEKVAEQIDAEVNELLTAAQKTAKQIITKQRATLDRIAHTLLEKESIERAEFEALVGPRSAAA